MARDQALLRRPGRMADMTPADTWPGLALGTAMHQLAVDALARGVGEALPTNAHYLSEHQLGAGTIQRALGFLAERDALTTTSHGHQGRRVQHLHLARLWQLGGLASVRVLMPPDGPEELNQLHTRVAQGLTDLGIPHMVSHLRGGVLRLESVRAGKHDIAVTSASAAELAPPPETSQALVRTLASGSYYALGSLVTVSRAGAASTARKRVAIDPDSPDHVALTKAEFPLDEETTYINVPFTSVLAAILRNEVDFGIWHRQETLIPLELAGLTTSPLTRPAAHQTWEQVSGAVLTGWAERPELAVPLAALDLDVKECAAAART